MSKMVRRPVLLRAPPQCLQHVAALANVLCMHPLSRPRSDPLRASGISVLFLAFALRWSWPSPCVGDHINVFLAAFSRYGRVEGVKMQNGFCFIEMESMQDANAAISGLDGYVPASDTVLAPDSWDGSEGCTLLLRWAPLFRLIFELVLVGLRRRLREGL